jgi:hypothetical protein
MASYRARAARPTKSSADPPRCTNPILSSDAGWFPAPNALHCWLAKLTKIDIDVLLEMLRYQNMGGGRAFPGASAIAKTLGHKGRRHVDRSINRLLKLKLLKCVRKGRCDSASEYVVTIPLSAESADPPIPPLGGIGRYPLGRRRRCRLGGIGREGIGGIRLPNKKD